MLNKDEVVASVRSAIVKHTLAGALQQLAAAEYEDCLTRLIGKKLTIENQTVVISCTGADWSIETRGLWNTVVMFNYGSRYDGVYEEFIWNASIEYTDRENELDVLHDIIPVVIHILTTYDSQGKKLKFPIPE